ncbi:Transport protein particle subunit bet3, partial [Colletotrichum tanaceti]
PLLHFCPLKYPSVVTGATSKPDLLGTTANQQQTRLLEPSFIKVPATISVLPRRRRHRRPTQDVNDVVATNKRASVRISPVPPYSLDTSAEAIKLGSRSRRLALQSWPQIRQPAWARIHICLETNNFDILDCRTRIDKVNAELVTLTYGTIVAQLCKDYDSDYAEVNKQLDKMGYNIGLRLIEDYLAKSNTMKRCANFRETADMIARVGFKIFLNITPQVTNWTTDNKQFSLVFDENPLADFVELPDDERAQDELWYSNIFCGVLRGALEMVQMQVEAHFISDVLRGHDTTEMRVSLVRYIDDELPPEDD